MVHNLLLSETDVTIKGSIMHYHKDSVLHYFFPM